MILGLLPLTSVLLICMTLLIHSRLLYLLVVRCSRRQSDLHWNAINV